MENNAAKLGEPNGDTERKKKRKKKEKRKPLYENDAGLDEENQ